MKYWVKALIFKLLSSVPTQLGDNIYHFLQERREAVSIKEDIKVKEKTYFACVEALSKKGIQLANKDVLEIGSGWMPTMPYFFKFLGKCRSVSTYDINHHFKPKRTAQLNDLFFRMFSIEAPSSAQPKDEYLPEGVHYFPSTNIVDQPPAPNSMDIVFSRFLLEHVQPDDLYHMHVGSKKYLREDGVIIHFVSPSDHRAYSDTSLSLYDFLQYSAEQWQRQQTRFDYHNRLRLPQYLDVFEKAGFEVIYKEYSTIVDNKKELEKFQKLKIHPDFMKYSVEELTASSMVFILKPVWA